MIEQHQNALANIEVLDNGKPFAEADFDIVCAVATFRYYAGWCDKIHGNTIPVGKCISRRILFVCLNIFRVILLYHKAI